LTNQKKNKFTCRSHCLNRDLNQTFHCRFIFYHLYTYIPKYLF